MKVPGRVHPDSIIGQIVADDIRAKRSIKKLPKVFQDSVIREAIAAMHELAEPDDIDKLLLPPQPRNVESRSLDAVIPKPGKKEYLVVRDDDLKLLDAVCTGAQAAAGAGYFLMNSITTPSVIAAITGIIISTFKMLRQLARKSAKVDPVRVQVILALKKGGTMSVAEIVKWLNAVLKNRTEPWSSEEVLSELSALKRTRLADGTVVAFVEETADGKWGIAGI